MSRLTLAILTLVGLAACGDRKPSQSLADRAGALAAGMNVDTLTVGGRREAVQFREASGATFPLPFTVRVPDPMAVTTDRTAAGESVRLDAAGMGAWTLTLLADGTDEATARAAADSVAGTLGTVSPADSAAVAAATAPASALASFRTAGAGRSGAVWLGQHAGRFYVVASDAADAAREAVDARVAYVLDSWRWTDDGTALGG